MDQSQFAVSFCLGGSYQMKVKPLAKPLVSTHAYTSSAAMALTGINNSTGCFSKSQGDVTGN